MQSKPKHIVLLTNDEFAFDLLQDEPGLIAELETFSREFAFQIGFALLVVVKTDVVELAQNDVGRVVFNDLVVPVEKHHRVTRQRRLDFEELRAEERRGEGTG